MEGSVAEITHCQLHSKRIEYLCMDTSCSSQIQCCMACVKTTHKECRDDLIVEVEKVPDIFEFKLKESISEINNSIKSIVDKNVNELDTSLAKFSRNLTLIEKKELSEEDVSTEFIQVLKNHYKANLKQDGSGVVEFVPLLNNNATELNLAKADFEAFLTEQMEELKTSVSKLTLDMGLSLDPSKFMCHSYIEMKDLGKELLFKRIEGNNENNYFSCIFKEPLLLSTKITVTIKGIQSSDPYLDIGLIDEDKFATYKSDPIISFASGTYSYCGTSISSLEGNFTGSKFEVNREVYMQYDPNKGFLEFTTDDGKVELSTHIPNFSKKYFLFFTLYHSEASCTIKKS